MVIFLQAAYFSHVSNLLMTAGAIVATIGACRIYYKWSSGQGNIENEIFQWVGGIIFLLASSVAVKALFGV
ncbi:MAG TPA: DUF4134 family protein [Segetibacter sp.]|jgi:hypothetical protein